jgi:hypothetical protein
MGHLGCRNDFGLARVGTTVADIVADRPMQQRCILSDHGDLRAEAFLRNCGDVLSVDQDAPAFQIEEPQ